jgi:hypothetical protein
MGSYPACRSGESQDFSSRSSVLDLAIAAKCHSIASAFQVLVASSASCLASCLVDHREQSQRQST